MTAKKDFLTTDGVLYCSLKCAREDKAHWQHFKGKHIEPQEYNQREYGALCPVCDEVYHSFDHPDEGTPSWDEHDE